MRITLATFVIAVALLPPASAGAADAPRYDVPPGYTKCPHATAWHGFFKWASAKRTTCRRAARFMHAYADAAKAGSMPRHVRGFRCRIRFWRDADGLIYASRHVCARARVVIRFYAMV